ALLFRAYTEAGIVEQWMGTKVLKLENRQHGAYAFETSDPQGNVLFKAHGTIHDVVEDQKIVRTFEMDNARFDAQFGFLDFYKDTAQTSKLTMQITYRLSSQSMQQLKFLFSYNIIMSYYGLQ